MIHAQPEVINARDLVSGGLLGIQGAIAGVARETAQLPRQPAVRVAAGPLVAKGRKKDAAIDLQGVGELGEDIGGAILAHPRGEDVHVVDE
jgi:hypothetical protein